MPLTTQLINLMPETQQLVQLSLAQHSVSVGCDKMYFICEAINQLISDREFTDEKLKEYLGENWQEKISFVSEMHNLLAEIHAFYEITPPNVITRVDVRNENFRILVENQKRFNVFDRLNIWRIFRDLYSMTSMCGRIIPRKILASERRAIKSFQFKEESEYNRGEEESKEDSEEEDSEENEN